MEKFLRKELSNNKKITISEHEAKQIAKNYLNGTIEKVKLQTNGESSHYLVWIDTDDDDVIIQIHAISGKILSVSSDDNDDDEDDDDDDDDDED